MKKILESDEFNIFFLLMNNYLTKIYEKESVVNLFNTNCFLYKLYLMLKQELTNI